MGCGKKEQNFPISARPYDVKQPLIGGNFDGDRGLIEWAFGSPLKEITIEPINLNDNKCIKFNNEAVPGPNIYGCISQPLNVQKGRTYIITYMVKSEKATDKTLVVTTDRGWNNRSYIKIGTYDWTQFTHKFTAEADQVPLVFFSENPGTVYLDDVKVEEIK